MAEREQRSDHATNPKGTRPSAMWRSTLTQKHIEHTVRAVLGAVQDTETLEQ